MTKSEWLEIIYNLSYPASFEALQKFVINFTPPRNTFIVTVGGTNGKGSTVTIIEQALVRAGISVVTNTSPHVKEYNERVRIDGTPLSDEFLVEGLEFITALVKQKEYNLSFPQYAFLLACYMVQKYQPKVLLLEVGLGGILDPSNTLDADMAVITNIDIDHSHILGATRDEVTINKIGIERAGKPLIIGDPSPPQKLLDFLSMRTGQTYLIGQDYHILESNDAQSLHPNNIATAGMALSLLSKEFDLEIPKPETFIDKIEILGRCQTIIFSGKKILVDVAHNKQSVQNLTHKLKHLKKTEIKRISVIFTAMETKDIRGMIAYIKPIIDHWHICSVSGIDKRGATTEHLQNSFTDIEKTTFYGAPKDCFDSVLSSEGKESELLVVFGSFILVGEFLNYCDQMQ